MKEMLQMTGPRPLASAPLGRRVDLCFRRLLALEIWRGLLLWLLVALPMLLPNSGAVGATPPSTRLVTLQCSGAGQKDVPAWSQTGSYQFTVNFQLNCRLIQQDDQYVYYQIEAAQGDTHFWGSATEVFGGAREEFDYDDAHSITAEGVGGTVIYSRTDDTILSLSLPLVVSAGEVTPYRLEYFADRGTPFARLYARLPSRWHFDEAYDSCQAARATFGSAIVMENMAVSRNSGFQYDSNFPEDPHWRMVAYGAWVQGTFTLERVPATAQLRIRHLSSAGSGAPGGGYSPVNIHINGQLFKACYDPAENHGGTHGFVVDSWDVASYLKAGVNIIGVQLCDTAWTYYWISHLSVYGVGEGCRECGADDLIHVDALEQENEDAHHTQMFADEASEVRNPAEAQSVTPRLILRRNQTFDVLLKGPRAAMQNLQVPEFQAEDLLVPAGSPALTPIPVGSGALDPGQWGAQAIGGMELSSNGNYSRRFRINLPVSAAFGEYAFLVRYRTDAAAPINERTFPVPVVVLFNPWTAAGRGQDDVHMADDSELREYVLNESGFVWQINGYSQPAETTWQFNQFSSPSCLTTLLKVSSSLAAAERRDCALFSRSLTSACNTVPPRRSGAPAGILMGNWRGDWSQDTDPSRWKASSEIFSRYLATGESVRYGQCWVFAGILTSLLRSAGIPARAVTAYNSAHSLDTFPQTVDRFYYRGRLLDPDHPNWNEWSGHPITTDTGIFEFPQGRPDGLWPYHVWCEGWISRDQIFDWQALDGTPQEPSVHPPNWYETGPAAQHAIRENAGGFYDVDFIRHEVSAPVYYWEVAARGPGDPWTATRARSWPWRPNPDTHKAGNPIITQSSVMIGHDITSAYKPLSAPVLLEADGISEWQVALNVPEAVALGDPIHCGASFDNQGPNARSYQVNLTLAIIANNGDTVRNLSNELDRVIQVPGSGTAQPTLTISAAEYLPLCTNSQLIEARLCVKELESGDFLVQERRLRLTHSEPTVLAPTVGHYQGESFPLALTWTNESSVTLPWVELTAIAGLASSLGSDGTVFVVASNVPPGGVVQIVTNLSGLKPQTMLATARVLGPWISGVATTVAINIAPPPMLSIQPRSDGACALSFPALVGRAYRLESSPTLTHPSWTQTTTNISGAGQVISVPIQPSGASAFYRVIALKQ